MDSAAGAMMMTAMSTAAESARHNRWADYALLGLLALLWGGSYPLLKVAVETIPPLTLIAARVGIAALILVAVVWQRGLRLPRASRMWRMLLLQAVFNSIGAWTILAWGQQFVDAGLATVLNSTSPIFVFLLTLLLSRHEAVGWQKFIGALFGLVGVGLIVGIEAMAGLGREVIAQLAIVAGAVLYACAAIYGHRFREQPAVVTAAGTMICATFCLIPAALLVDRPWTLTPAPVAVAATVFSGVFSTAMAFLIYFRLVKTLGSMGVASQSYLRVGVGVGLGVLLLGETVTWSVAGGLICVVIGVAAINGSFGSWGRRT